MIVKGFNSRVVCSLVVAGVATIPRGRISERVVTGVVLNTMTFATLTEVSKVVTSPKRISLRNATKLLVT